MTRPAFALAVVFATATACGQQTVGDAPPTASENAAQSTLNSEPNESEGAPPTADRMGIMEVPVSGIALFNNFVDVVEGGVTQVVVKGAASAFSNDLSVAEVSTHNETVYVFGKSKGQAYITVYTPNGIKDFSAYVKSAPVSYPAGFVPPLAASKENEVGDYETRYFSDRKQLQNRIDLTVAKPDMTTQVHLVTSTFLSSEVDKPTTLPSGYYHMATKDWKLGLLDETVSNSPLTVNQTSMRGVHFEYGPWTLHAGFASLATIDDFLVPVEHESAAGLGYTQKLSRNSSLTGSVYYFPTPPSFFQSGRAGGVSSLAYRLRLPNTLELLAELAYSHGIGGSAEAQYSSKKDALYGSFQRKPQEFASLSIADLPGTNFQLSWSHQLTQSLYSNMQVSSTYLLLPTFQQKNQNAMANLQYKLSQHWTVSSGGLVAIFSQVSGPSPVTLHTLSLPQVINFDGPTFGVGAQYTASKISGSYVLGQSLRGTGRIKSGNWQLSGYMERQTDALSMSSIFSELPALTDVLQRLGITITDPRQLLALLQDTRFLDSIGLPPGVNLHLVPVRTQAGANLSWTSRGPRPAIFNLNFMKNKDQSLKDATSSWIQSGEFSHPVSDANNLYVAYSWFHLAGLSKQYAPLYEVGFKHNFRSLPRWIDPIHHGTVTGVVFVDEQRTGKYTAATPELEGVEVVLDGSDHTHTNKNGRYLFPNIPQGNHTIEVRYHSDHPYWFTTPSTTSAEMNSTVNFGITFAASQLLGVIKNDAGFGVPNVEVDITAQGQLMHASTDEDGRFLLSGLAPGDYEININPDSVPLGYMLEELKPAIAHLEKGLTGRAEMQLQAVRSFSGEVSYYDVSQGTYVPVRQGEISIEKLGRKTTTDDAGKFRFNELPPGDYVVSLIAANGSIERPIAIPTGPADLRETFHLPNLPRGAGMQ